MNDTATSTPASADHRSLLHGGSPNEVEAAMAWQDAVSQYGPASPQADAARRHLRLIQHFNERFAWFRD